MKRDYLAIYDNGYDYGEFEFQSEHRAGSNANMHDALVKMIDMYGTCAIFCCKIVQIVLK